MAKALLFSDLHLHAHKDRVDRLHDCVAVLDWVFQQAKKHECRYIFFLGDLFHERARIDVLNYLRTFEVFMKHMIEDASDREFYLLVGNHDMYHRERWDVNSVKPLTAIPRVHIVETPQQMQFGNLRIDWMPHTDNPVKDLKAFHKNPGRILFGHMAVHGAELNTYFGTKADVIVEYDNDMIPIDQDVFTVWEWVFLGHYHGAQILGNVEYLGSPLQLTFGETEQEKHVVILDLDTLEKKYVVNDFSPKHLIMTPQQVHDEPKLLKGNFIRLCYDGLSQKELLDIGKLVSDQKALSFDAKPKDKKQEDDKMQIAAAKSILMDISKMIDLYIEQRGAAGLDEAKLRKMAFQCLEKT